MISRRMVAIVLPEEISGLSCGVLARKKGNVTEHMIAEVDFTVRCIRLVDYGACLMSLIKFYLHIIFLIN